MSKKLHVGVPIYKEYNEKCEYCKVRMDELEGFCVCINPLANVVWRLTGGWIINCAPIATECKYDKQQSTTDLMLVSKFIDLNKEPSEGYVVITHDELDGFINMLTMSEDGVDEIEEDIIGNMDLYLIQLFNYFRYARIVDTEHMADDIAYLFMKY